MHEATITLSLSWAVRSWNTLATRLTVVTFPSESAIYSFILFHETFPAEDEIDLAIPAGL